MSNAALLNDDLLRDLPKTDLHLHLDGSLRLATLIELAQERGVELPAWTEAELRASVFRQTYSDLGEYLHGFKYTCAVLRDEAALERCAFELAEDNFAEGVRYIEIRFAPQLHMHAELTMRQVLEAVTRGLRRAEAQWNARDEVRNGVEPPCRAAIIVCAMRMFTAGFSPWYRDYVAAHSYRPLPEIIRMAGEDLAYAAVRLRDELQLPIVGFDLAGQENGWPAGVHQRAYGHAHGSFLKKTVHAGEAFGPESIFQAITRLYADRIGHGYHLFSPERISSPDITDPEAYVQALTQYIADRRITIEVCLTSNLQTMPELTSLRDHAFRHMLDAKLSTTICTDNRLISDTTVPRELALAIEHFDLSPRQLRQIIIYGFKRSFFPGSYAEKRGYVRDVIERFEAVYRRHGLA
jgi:adenosine deaminase